MRGKETDGWVGLATERITPAYAGKSRIESFGTTGKKDHPRVCGEKPDDFALYNIAQGSPPRMRGKASAPRLVPPPSRITPAYAGKSSVLVSVTLLAKDHPRVCGEKTKKIP